jgi:hypothetical protein
MEVQNAVREPLQLNGLEPCETGGPSAILALPENAILRRTQEMIYTEGSNRTGGCWGDGGGEDKR